MNKTPAVDARVAPDVPTRFSAVSHSRYANKATDASKEQRQLSAESSEHASYNAMDASCAWQPSSFKHYAGKRFNTIRRSSGAVGSFEFSCHRSSAQKREIYKIVKSISPRRGLQETSHPCTNRTVGIELTTIVQSSAKRLRYIYSAECREHWSAEQCADWTGTNILPRSWQYACINRIPLECVVRWMADLRPLGSLTFNHQMRNLFYSRCHSLSIRMCSERMLTACLSRRDRTRKIAQVAYLPIFGFFFVTAARALEVHSIRNSHSFVMTSTKQLQVLLVMQHAESLLGNNSTSAIYITHWPVSVTDYLQNR